jgi:hypothetical protein
MKAATRGPALEFRRVSSTCKGRLLALLHPTGRRRFGIGSDIAVQAYGALGCQIIRNIFSEVGYRYLYDDFRDTNFLYQLSLHGAQITVGLTF